ncbi:phosphoribosylformylglycinamidine synthase subunit PurQ [Paraliomyxa miuraensis]|uniref:phosphoribosylformylglycinamidine synthase subunit PurQ n=1 Tax=Paraliomyxa miuraensis TaxID=376150 RepID=UPI00225C1EC8|nr:phosphoribosylformylglycinamidine synthase subunit PurQ [Paraliomyxa miuraensis]MCX4243286.1 phosphoribosylformylglycinamidine synthase subunit PurQ [Paraliomyxa miuraensis]
MSEHAQSMQVSDGDGSPWDFVPGPVPGARDVRALVLSGYGLNCEAETAAGLRMAGARAEIVHVGDLVHGGGTQLDGAHMLVFVGGFSFGDHIASGRVFANRMRFGLGERLARFVDDGGLVLGICNGFQTIVKLGLLPALDRRPGQGLAPQQASLVHNDRLGYRDAWVRLSIDSRSPCVFTRGSTGVPLPVPSRHGEGKLVLADEAVRARVEGEHLVPVRYVDADGNATEAWPDNPNGSMAGMAGLCDASGRVFGLMPHPEAYLYPENHPRWIAQRDRGRLPAVGHGLGILVNGVRAAVE